MSKKLLIAGSAVLVVLLGMAGGYLIFSKKDADRVDTSDGAVVDSSTIVSDSKFKEPLTDYSDDSGYSFSYPESLKLEDVTPDGDDYYSSLELSKSTENMKIDLKTGNVDPYKADKSAKSIGTTSLAGIKATEYEISSRRIIVAIDQGVLYIIDAPKDVGFWQDAQKKIVSSFKFAGQAPAGTSAVDSANTDYEEEVVE